MKYFKGLFLLLMLPHTVFTMNKMAIISLLNESNAVENPNNKRYAEHKKYSKAKKLKIFIAKEALECSPEENDTILLAAQLGNYELLEDILSHGQHPDISDQKGNTPLMLAAKNGSIECVKILLQYGATEKLCNRKGSTAFILSLDHENDEISWLLMSRSPLYQNLYPVINFWEANIKNRMIKTDCIEIIKEAMSIFEHNKKKSLFSIDLKNHTIPALRKAQKSHCVTTALLLIALLTGIILKNHQTWCINGIEQKIPATNVYCGNYTDFAGYKEEYGCNLLFTRLFLLPKKPAHNLVYVNLFEGAHAFLIEIKIDNSSTFHRKEERYYRIFESNLNQFTLSEWLGLEPWKVKKDATRWLLAGNGKWISSTETLYLIKSLCDEWRNDKEVQGTIELHILLFDLLQPK